ncbi:MAG: Mth938-like domain-containing protein [Alphaproteobacteria bacterium]
MADVSPRVPAGRQVKETYGEMRFRISGQRNDHADIVLPETVLPWAPASWDDVDFDSFRALCQAQAADVLLLGCGARAQFPSKGLRRALRAEGLVVEPMDTGAACRTYNVLMAEDRRVAAALLPVA